MSLRVLPWAISWVIQILLPRSFVTHSQIRPCLLREKSASLSLGQSTWYLPASDLLPERGSHLLVVRRRGAAQGPAQVEWWWRRAADQADAVAIWVWRMSPCTSAACTRAYTSSRRHWGVAISTPTSGTSKGSSLSRHACPRAPSPQTTTEQSPVVTPDRLSPARR